MIPLLLAALLAASHVPCPQPHRSRGAVAKFRRAHPCPGGRDKGSKTRCAGWIVDHWCPLSCCGLDAPQNMVWQTVKDAKAKDRIETKDCARFCARPNPQR